MLPISTFFQIERTKNVSVCIQILICKYTKLYIIAAGKVLIVNAMDCSSFPLATSKILQDTSWFSPKATSGEVSRTGYVGEFFIKWLDRHFDFGLVVARDR